VREGADSARREGNDVMPFQNLFSDNGLVEYINERRRAFLCIRYPVACTVAGPHGAEFLHRGGYLKECVYRQFPGYVISDSRKVGLT
jgi:hypothetical protein